MTLSLASARGVLTRFGGTVETYERERRLVVTMPRGRVTVAVQRTRLIFDAYRPGRIPMFNVRPATAINVTSLHKVPAGLYHVYRAARRDLASWYYWTNAPAKLAALDVAICEAAFGGDPAALAALTDRLIDATETAR